MRISLKNIGIVEQAQDVYLDGLTVVAGENDSGKSTVGKVLFSIIKAITRHDSEFEQGKRDRIEPLLEEINFTLRRIPSFSDRVSKTIEQTIKLSREIETRIEYLIEFGDEGDLNK